MSTIRDLVSAGDVTSQLEGLQGCSSQEQPRLLGAQPRLLGGLLEDGCKVVIPPHEALAVR